MKKSSLDNNITGKISNISHLLNTNKLEFINHDVKEPISLKVDKIWHLACPASPQHYQLDPIETAKTCFLGTLNMLNLAKKNLMQKFSLLAQKFMAKNKSAIRKLLWQC